VLDATIFKKRIVDTPFAEMLEIMQMLQNTKEFVILVKIKSYKKLNEKTFS